VDTSLLLQEFQISLCEKLKEAPSKYGTCSILQFSLWAMTEQKRAGAEEAIDFAFEARLDYSIGFSSLRGF